MLALVGEHLTNQRDRPAGWSISVRTVESHVSSLLRKLGVTDRRALAELAAGPGPSPRRSDAHSSVAAVAADLVRGPGGRARRARRGSWPGTGWSPPSARAAWARPGLPSRSPTDVADRYADGAWYVDLVPVTDPAMVGAAVADAFGFGEQPGRSPTDTVVAKLAGAEALVVLDNCEHLAGRGRRLRRTAAHRLPARRPCWRPAGPGCGCRTSSSSRCPGCRSRTAGERQATR